MNPPDKLSDWLPAINVSVRTIILFITVLSLPLTASGPLNLSNGQTTSWILFFYSLTGLISLMIAIYYRQPIMFTGNIFALIFIVSLGGAYSFSELMGTFIVTGCFVLLVSILGLTEKLAAWIPAPVVFGLLAGAIMPFVSNIFTALDEMPLIVGLTLGAYFLSGRIFVNRLPAIFPALVVGLAAVFLTGQAGAANQSVALFDLSFTRPVFAVAPILTITPILLVLIILQSNLPSIIFMRSQGYHPPGRVIDLVSSIGTIVGSFFGPMAVSISLPITSLVSGEEAGKFQFRQRTVYFAAGGAILIGLLAGIATFLPVILPAAFITTMAGLALVGVLINAIKHVTGGPLVIGPIFAFAIALSDISLLGFGPFFWALLIGTAVSLVLEPEGFSKLQTRDRENEKAS